MKRRALLSAIVLLLLATAVGAGEIVALIRVKGVIGPSTADYVNRAVDEASQRNAQCLIIELDTPGGLLDSTKAIVQKLYAAPIPVVVYVAPAGATATSAGCFITLAGHVAAMAPATTIGAAHPVQMGGDGSSEAKPDETMKTKLENYSVSYVEAIAQKRSRNVEWAKSAVKDSASIPGEKALELKVIDLMATDMTDLLHKLDGREFDRRPLKTENAQVVEIRMSVRESVFQTLWRPEVLFILMLVAIYGIVGELSSPGAILPGVAGVIALVLALYMSAILPVSAAGLLMIALSLVLFAIDVFAPTHGALTVGGIVAFFIGGLMLFDRSEPAFRLSLAYLIPATVTTAAFFLFVVGKGLRAQSLPVKAGSETMLGKSAEALTDIDQDGGTVFIEGEYWKAASEQSVAKGGRVRVNRIQGLTLIVEGEPPA